LVLDEEITEIWNEFEMGVHFNDAVLGFEMRIGVQSRLEALNPVLTVDYIADNFHREPSAYGKDWTPEMLESATNIGAADACYFGIFPGSKCESNGRVYRINAPWYGARFPTEIYTRGCH
jgi:hypothetical protein